MKSKLLFLNLVLLISGSGLYPAAAGPNPSDESDVRGAVQRIFDHEYSIDSAEDHGGTISVYLRDPDDNGIELYYDRPREEWFDAAGNPKMKAEPFDPRELLAEATC